MIDVEVDTSGMDEHLWVDRGMVLIAQRPRFGSSAAGRNAERKRKVRKCRHCGRRP